MPEKKQSRTGKVRFRVDKHYPKFFQMLLCLVYSGATSGIVKSSLKRQKTLTIFA